MTIRLLLVDDQALFREGLSTLLSVWDDLEIVGEAENGQVAVEKTAVLNPDVILMDLRMPVLDGVAATRQINQQNPHSKVIVLTTYDKDEYQYAGLRAGALPKAGRGDSHCCARRHLLAAVRGGQACR